MQALGDRIYPVDDPIIDYRYRPSTTHWEGDIAFQYNSSGFRDEDHSTERTPGVSRIVVLGDSVTEGYGVRLEDSFSAKLRERLGPTVEVITLGMGGLNSSQEMHLLEQEGLQYRPDMVVVNFVLNDCDFYASYGPAIRYAARMDSEIGILGISVDPRLKRMLKSSALLYYIKQKLEQFTAGDGEDVDYVLRIWKKPENRALISSALSKLRSMRDQAGFAVSVLIWPVIVELDDYPYREIHDWISAAATAEDLIVIDLLPDFARGGPTSSYWITRDDIFHPNARGHEVAAEAFERRYPGGVRRKLAEASRPTAEMGVGTVSGQKQGPK